MLKGVLIERAERSSRQCTGKCTGKCDVGVEISGDLMGYERWTASILVIAAQ
jgi:hypothetical protein